MFDGALVPLPNLASSFFLRLRDFPKTLIGALSARPMTTARRVAAQKALDRGVMLGTFKTSRDLGFFTLDIDGTRASRITVVRSYLTYLFLLPRFFFLVPGDKKPPSVRDKWTACEEKKFFSALKVRAIRVSTEFQRVRGGFLERGRPPGRRAAGAPKISRDGFSPAYVLTPRASPTPSHADRRLELR